MAILIGINTKLKGSAGEWTFEQRKGQTIAKQKITKKRTPVRTEKQMVTRMQWANAVNLWRAFDGTLHPAFEFKTALQSDYNMFMSANLGITAVFLTKSMARQGACILAEYQISRGTLPMIEVSDVAGVKCTNIALGTLVPDADTTVSALANAIINNNSTFYSGDQITFFHVIQKVDNYGIPYVQTEATVLPLDPTSQETLSSIGSLYGFTAVQGCLGTAAAPNEEGVAWVHSRKTLRTTHVSSQKLVVNGNIASNYNDATALNAAIESYGGVNQLALLTPAGSMTVSTSSGTFTSGTPANTGGNGGNNTGGNTGSGQGGDPDGDED